MPNTPAAIGQGFTAAFAGPGVSEAQRGCAIPCCSAIGDVAWVADEAQIDAVTATSGSGPAYVFLLAELLEAGAIEQGLPPALARRLARRTVAGSGALLAASDEDAAAMRRAVTSPGGTTERALGGADGGGCLAGLGQPRHCRCHGTLAGVVIVRRPGGFATRLDHAT